MAAGGPRIAVLGAGITGLSLAHFLRQALGNRGHVTLLEARGRVGGSLESLRYPSRSSGREYLFERGCRGFGGYPGLHMLTLLHDLGLRDKIVFAPRHLDQVFVRSGHSMLPLPSALQAGARQPLLGWATEWFRSRLSPKPTPDDESVDEFFRQGGFSEYLLHNLLDPVLTGTFGGDLAHMSMAATFPEWYPDLERRQGVTQALKRVSRDAFGDATKDILPGVLQLGMNVPGYSFEGGTQVLADTLASTLLEHDNTEIWTDCPVEAVERADGGGVTVFTGGEIAEDTFSHVFSTVDPETFADVLPASCEDARRTLSEFMLTSYWVVNLGYAEPLELYDGLSGFDTTEAHEGLGYFVPSSEDSPVMRVGFDSNLFPDQATGPETRLSVLLGRGEHLDRLRDRPMEEVAYLAADTVAMHLDNDALSTPDAADAVYARHGHALPHPGHATNMEAIRSDLAQQVPGLHVVGSGYSGMDVSGCVYGALNAAIELQQQLFPQEQT